MLVIVPRIFMRQKLNGFGVQYDMDSWTLMCCWHIYRWDIFDLNHISPDSGTPKQHLLLDQLKWVRTNSTVETYFINSTPRPREQNLPYKSSKFPVYFDKYKIMAGQTTHNLEFIKASAQFHAVGKIGFPQIPKSHFPSQASVVSLVPVIMASGSWTPEGKVTSLLKNGDRLFYQKSKDMYEFNINS